MKTTLNDDGKIGIPDEIRQTDHLTAGDSFELELTRDKGAQKMAGYCGLKWVNF